MAYYKILNIPMLYSRTLLFIHSICNSLYLLTKTLNPTFPHSPTPLATTSLLPMSVSPFLFHR